MKKLVQSCVVLCLVITSVTAMAQTYEPLVRVGASGITHGMRFAVREDVTAAIVQQRPERLSMRLPIQGGDSLSLRRTTVLVPDGRYVAVTRDGAESLPMADYVVYTGPMRDASSLACVVVSAASVLVYLDDGQQRTIVGPSRDGSDALVADEDRNAGRAGLPFCGTADDDITPRAIEALRSAIDKADAVQHGLAPIELELAIEADYRFFRYFDGNRDRVTSYLTQLLAVCSQIYERDLGTVLRASYIRVWEQPADPYADNLSVADLLDPALRYYSSTMDTVDRDAVVMLTARGGQGGIAASIGGLCLNDLAFCLCDINGTVEDASTWSWDVNLVTHEIGHVLGAVHTHSCLWPDGPLDSCVAAEGSTCTGVHSTRPSMGTIMSYCHQTKADGGGITMVFHDRHKRVMRSFLERLPCTVGNILPQRNRLTGTVRHAVTKQPLSNVVLRLSVRSEDYMVQTPEIQGPSVVRTDAAGRYSFDGVGTGMYNIVLPDDHCLWPLSFKGSLTESCIGVVVSDSTQNRDIELMPASLVRLDVQGFYPEQSYGLQLVSPMVYFYSTSLRPTAAQRQQGTIFRQALPPGSYTFVPMGDGLRFTPPSVHVVVTDTGLAQPLPKIRCARAGWNEAFQLVAVTGAINRNGYPTLSGGEVVEFVRTLYSGDTLVDRLVSNEDGVAVFQPFDPATTYRIRSSFDTTAWVDATDGSVSLDHRYDRPVYLFKRARTFPLTVRPLEFSASIEPFEPIVPDTVLATATPQGTGFFASRVGLPFPIRIGDVQADSVLVYGSGFLSFGPSAIYEPSYATVTSTSPADMVVSPFGTRLVFLAGDGILGTIGTQVVGTAPNRTFIVEWRHVSSRMLDFAAQRWTNLGDFTFQTRFSESEGGVDIVYGPMVGSSSSLQWPVEIGMRGRDQLDRQQLQFKDATPQWLLPEIETGALDYQNDCLLGAGVMPPTGLTYRWRERTQPVVVVSETAGHDLQATMDADGTVHLDGMMMTASEGDMRIVDVNGRVAHRVGFTAAAGPVHQQWVVGRLPAGLYFLVVTPSSAPSFSMPLVSLPSGW